MRPFPHPSEAVQAISDLIALERGRQAITEREFGEAVGVEQCTVNHWLSGKRVPGRANCERLAEAVNYQVQPYQIRPDLFVDPQDVAERRQQVLSPVEA